MRLNEAVGETWDDRDLALRKVKGNKAQKRGAKWADALHVHTARTARCMYMHISKKHLSKLVQVNECPANGDDQPFETRHRLNKRLGKLTYNGVSAQADRVARIVMQRRTKQLVVAPGPGSFLEFMSSMHHLQAAAPAPAPAPTAMCEVERYTKAPAEPMNTNILESGGRSMSSTSPR